MRVMATSGTKKKGSNSTRATDFGPPELAKRFTIVPKLSATSGYHGKVADDTEIDHLLLLDRITSAEHSMLVALLQKLHKATFVGLKSPDFNGVAHSDPSRMADRKANAVMSVCYLMKKMDQLIGRGYRTALINLVLLDAPWPGTIDSLRQCVLTLQDIMGAGQRELRGKQPRQDKFPVGVHAHH
jgi:hypothetical protein